MAFTKKETEVIVEGIAILIDDLINALMDEVHFCLFNGLDVSENSLSVLKRCRGGMNEVMLAKLKIIQKDM